MTSDSNITVRIQAFKSDLLLLTDSMMVQKHITYGDCFVLGQGDYFELKSEVSDRFRVHPSEVVVVGSGKLGFSIAPSKRYRIFGDESDIDLAIVSTTLFEQIWTDVFEYTNEGESWQDEKEFKDYLFRGWVRPDKLPPANKFAFCREWWDYFRGLERQGRYGDYKIRAGIYKSWRFLESYQTSAVRGCREEIGGQA